ncbi:MAG: 4-hydroxythreonine-4-phosphate dehydrogenase PdxA [Kiritimatiellia bacterium]
MISFLPRIAVTTGDCAGIGPELVLHAFNSKQIAECANLSVYGNLNILKTVSLRSGISFNPQIRVVKSAEELKDGFQGHVLINSDTPDLTSIRPRTAQQSCGAAAAAWIETAVKDTISGKSDAVVTAPINKSAINMAGVNFPGHTEMLASLCHTEKPCMAFYSPGLIISLATIHTALSTVPTLLTPEHLLHVCKMTDGLCRQQGIQSPAIGILALNPHAGENGLFGNEELEIIIPLIAEARRQGINLSGPLVPDTAFTWLYPPVKPAPFDAYIAMYHDQALIPFKMAAFDKGVNITLGLPIIRTSPDHGTAYDLAWQGKASPGSFFQAIRMAARMAVSRKNEQEKN